MEELLEIQRKLRAPKGQTNTFGKYKYRSCEDILEAVKPLIPDGCNLVIFDTIEHIGDRYYVKATAMFSKGTEVSISITAYAREEADKKGMDAAQITGACSSYARKYALNGLFLIDDTKDADTMDNTKSSQLDAISRPSETDVPEPEQLGSGPVNATQKKVLAGLMKAAGLSTEEQKDFFGYVKPKDYAAAQLFIEDFKSYLTTYTNHKTEAMNE